MKKLFISTILIIALFFSSLAYPAATWHTFGDQKGSIPLSWLDDNFSLVSSALGSDTMVMFNDGGLLAGNENFTWNKSTKLLYAWSIDTTGISASGSITGPGNLLYLNGHSGFTGYLIKVELNTADRFSIDYNGLLQTSDISTHGLSITGTVTGAGNLAFLNGYPGFTGDLLHLEQNSVAKFSVDYTGKATLLAFKMVTGAGLGKVIVSDASGNGTWQITPGAGLDTYVQYNDGGVMGADSSLFWNKSTKLLTAHNIATTGISVNGTTGTSGNAIYSNGETGFTGNLIVGALNGTIKFWVDYAGKGGLLDDFGLQNNKTFTAKDMGGTSRNVASIGTDDNLYIGADNDIIPLYLGSGSALPSPVYIRVGSDNFNITAGVNDSGGDGLRCLTVPNL